MVAASLTLLSPRAMLVGVPALLAVAATAYGLRRAGAVRRVLRLPAAGPGRARWRLALVAAVVALLTLAAAQPALTRDRGARSRKDVQVLFVFDVSRSMAASTGPRTPTRLDRAADAAVRLRRAVADVPAGVATLTDRVLPGLLPVADASGFDRVVQRSLQIESPPPQRTAVRATSYDALAQIPGNGYFAPKTPTRIVVVLTDGESAPVQTTEVADAYAAAPGSRVVFVRVWGANEKIYDENGRAESAYRPDPSGAATLDDLASSLGGRAYDEGSLGAAERRLRAIAGSGPTTAAAGPAVEAHTPLAPYLAALALLAVAALVGAPARRVPWATL